MRVLFCTTGGLGHLLPLRPLGRALQRRGHAVGWVTAPDALHMLNGLGFDLFDAGPSFDVSRRQFRAAYAQGVHLVGEQLSGYTFPRLFGAVLAPAMVRGVEEAVHLWRPDVVVHEPAALAVPLVCQPLGLPHVTHGYGLRPPRQYLEDAMAFLGTEWRARGLQVPADGGLYRYLYMDIAPRSLQAPGQPARGDVFPFNPFAACALDGVALPAEVQQALQSAAPGPRIYVTFGTVFNRSPAMLAAVRAASRVAAMVVVTVGADGDPEPFARMGGRVCVQRFVDQTALLPHCDLVVSHGGAGTVLGAAAYGMPQLILPQAADHFRNARALTWVNAGRLLEPADQTPERISEAMLGALQTDAMVVAARKLAGEMSSMPDATAAASRLERW